MRKSTIPGWAIARKKIQKVDPGDELVQDMQFISYLVVFGSSVEYANLTHSEQVTTDRLLRMGVLVEAEAGSKKVKLAEAWRTAIEDRQKSKQ
ncbi:MAG: hypothetical protein OK474_09940 [Thaumarchaeota archaeon]|nr:hypothetical protein [Nitrososphaerota archaeon]